MAFFRLPKTKHQPKQRTSKGPTRRKEASQKNIQRAVKLRDVLAKHRRLQGPYSKQKWALDIAELEKETKTWTAVESMIIDAVLDWYCKRCNGPNIPRVWSAKSFVYRFGHLWDLMVLEEGPVANAGDQAKRIASRLTSSRFPFWPDEAVRQLPAAVQLSLDNYLPFYKKVMSLVSQARMECKREGGIKGDLLVHDDLEKTRIAQLLDVVDVEVTEVDSFLYYWFAELYELRARWNDWDGRLHKQIWEVDHPRYVNRMKAWANKMGFGKQWDSVLELVNEA